jgi:hypothetical protein
MRICINKKVMGHYVFQEEAQTFKHSKKLIKFQALYRRKEIKSFNFKEAN